MACAEFDNSLLFSGASSIPLCYVLFPATLPHQLFFHLLSPHLTIYFLVYLSLLFPYAYIILFWESYFLPFSVHVQTNLFDLTLCSVIIVILKSYARTIFLMMLSDKVGVIWWRCLMNNEFVKVHNELKPILLRAWMQRKQQQQYKIEIIQISKQSCTVSVMICVNDVRRMQLSVYGTNSFI